MSQSVNVSTDYLFTGQEKDPESNLYNYNARLYNPKTGAFVSADMVGSGNRYSYAANNPLVFTDPTGHQPAYDSCVGGGGGRSPDDVLQYEISGGGVGQPGITATTPINPTVGTNPSPSQLYFTQQDYEFWMRFMSDFGAITTGITTLAIGVPAWLQFACTFYYYKYFHYNPADLVEIGPGLASTQAALTMDGQSLIKTAGAGAVEAVKTGEITDRLRVWGEVKQGDNAYLDESMRVLEDLAHKGGIRAGYGEPGDATWEGVKRELQQALTQEPMSGAVVNLPGGSDRLHIKVLPTGEIRVRLIEYLSLPETVARFREIFSGEEFFIK